MSACINTLDPEYQKLNKVLDDGIKPFLDYYVLKFLDEKGRYPKVDEIPNASTKKALENGLRIKKYDSGMSYCSTQNVLDYTQTNTVEEAMPVLNNDMHPDLETEIISFGNSSIIINHTRPQITNNNISDIDVETDNSDVKNRIILTDLINKLSELYGIKIIPKTTKEINAMDANISDAGYVNAFIYNSDIYVNTDIARLDAPIHELSHIIIGSLRFLNPSLYNQLLSVVYTIPGYNFLFNSYTGRTQNDINEEIFVTEFAKYLVGYNSHFDNINKQQIDEIMYHIKRVIDSMVFGQYSVKNLSENKLLQSSLLELGKKTKSVRFNNQYITTLDLATLHRTLNNTKSDLLKSNELIQECE